MIEVIGYEENRNKEEYILGIATFRMDNDIHCYQVNRGKNGSGIYVSSFSRKMNDTWFKGHEIDSRVKKAELEKAIKDYIAKPTAAVKSKATLQAPEEFDDSGCPF